MTYQLPFIDSNLLYNHDAIDNFKTVNLLMLFSEYPSINGVRYNSELDKIQVKEMDTPSNIYSTWYYWVLYYFHVEKIMKKDIVVKLNERYPWYCNQNRTDKSKAIELTRLLKGMNNGVSFRSGKIINKVTDEQILAALSELSSIQKTKLQPIKQGDWEKLMVRPINRDTFKRRLGKIVRNKTGTDALNVLNQVKSIHGPWKIPEWTWYFN